MNNSILHTLARSISIVMYPLFIPTYGMLLWLIGFSHQMIPLPARYWLVSAIGTFFFTCFIPLSLILYMYLRGQLRDLYITEAKDRTTPYVYTITGFAIWTYFTHTVLHTPQFLTWVAGGATRAIVAVVIINHWWKISAHLTAIGGLLGGLCSYCIYYGTMATWPIVGALLISLLVMYARLYEGAHTSLQVVAGYLLGLSFTTLPTLLLFHA